MDGGYQDCSQLFVLTPTVFKKTINCLEKVTKFAADIKQFKTFKSKFQQCTTEHFMLQNDKAIK